MIALSSDFMLFRMGNGEELPFSADMITVELTGETTTFFDAEFVKQAAQAVFHYFRQEQKRQAVTMSEFAEALEKVLRGFALNFEERKRAVEPSPHTIGEADLGELACESGKGCELFFFPRLRDELQEQLRKGPKLVHFSGLRRCVKQLIGAKRWNAQCRSLQDEIIAYLRKLASTEAGTDGLSLRVD